MPEHPVVPMLKALDILWEHIPLVTVDTIFTKFRANLYEVIRLASKLGRKKDEDPEAIFFEMAARGLLAEYYADDGQYMKAISEASKAYGLLKQGFDLTEEVPEFYFTVGIYNYFREKYPEKYPVYKPFMWLFKSGDAEKGLEQIKIACEKTVISRVEAYVYLSYIYLRYEYKPRRAQQYLIDLNRDYPNNPYIQTKLLESLTSGNDFEKASLEMIRGLAESDRPYYQLAGRAFWGFYEERVNANTSNAIYHYKVGLKAGSDIKGHGEFYKSLVYLGLGRIHYQREEYDQAEDYLEEALRFAETKYIEEEARELLDQL